MREYLELLVLIGGVIALWFKISSAVVGVGLLVYILKQFHDKLFKSNLGGAH